MFRAALNRMENQQTEVLEFAKKMNRLTLGLEDTLRALGAMESFSEITAWLWRTEEAMEVQAERAKELGMALGSVIRYYRSSEEKILSRLEEGPPASEDERLSFVTTTSPVRWSELLRF